MKWCGKKKKKRKRSWKGEITFQRSRLTAKTAINDIEDERKKSEKTKMNRKKQGWKNKPTERGKKEYEFAFRPEEQVKNKVEKEKN